MDRLLTMRVFQAVVDEGGFAAAARWLELSPPVVTRLVADLEQHLGTRLLQRTTRKLALTEAGDVQCGRPRHLENQIGKHTSARSAEQAALRTELKRLYSSDDLRGYKCEDSWHFRDFDEPKQERPPKLPDLSVLALVIKVLLVAGGVALLAWLLYRYRGKFGWLLPAPAVHAATEIAGLDIRAESLPADVAGAVRSLWDQGDRRGALALLYRATLSRLVQQDGLLLAQGATEGDYAFASAQAELPRHATSLER
eukprot:gene39539-48855_t